jgi:hypothetical protein
MSKSLDINIKSRTTGALRPYRIVCEKCNEYDALIDLKRIDMTNYNMRRSLFRYTFVTPVQACVELNLIRAYTFRLRHESSCKKATFRVDEDEGANLIEVIGGVA